MQAQTIRHSRVNVKGEVIADFEVQHESILRRTMQDKLTGATYHLKVRFAYISRTRVCVYGLINGRLEAYQEWNLSARHAQKYGTASGFLTNSQQALHLAFDFLESRVLNPSALQNRDIWNRI